MEDNQPELKATKDLLTDFMKVCKVKQYDEVKTYVKELQKRAKYTGELAEKLTKLK